MEPPNEKILIFNRVSPANRKWVSRYGPTFTYRGFLGGRRLITTDPVAIAHILGNPYQYPKPGFIKDALAGMALGHDGLLTVEGDDHQRQRRILTAAFSVSHIKSLTPIFWEKALQLRDIWLLHDPDAIQPAARTDVLVWLGRATLDVIGLAGFGYAFNSLSQDSNELASAFDIIFSTASQFRVITILQAWFPILRHFRRQNAIMVQAKNTMRRIGLDLIDEKRRAITAEDEKGLGRDLLSVLMRSNISSTPSQRMSTEEVLCQISTFLAAGHETTCSALTWCLYALAKDCRVQSKLRDTLRGFQGQIGAEDYRESLTNQIMKCDYLDWVVRECLRLHAPVTNTMRVCMRDYDEIPLFNPIHDQGLTIPIQKWDIISVPIQAINKGEMFWGKDGGVFRPERWESPPQGARLIPGLYSNMMTFLNGNRACIGYKFAIFEIKIFLYVLIKDAAFSMDSGIVIQKKVNIVARPFVKHFGNQMPLDISRVPP